MYDSNKNCWNKLEFMDIIFNWIFLPRVKWPSSLKKFDTELREKKYNSILFLLMFVTVAIFLKFALNGTNKSKHDYHLWYDFFITFIDPFFCEVIFLGFFPEQLRQFSGFYSFNSKKLDLLKNCSNSRTGKLARYTCVLITNKAREYLTE